MRIPIASNSSISLTAPSDRLDTRCDDERAEMFESDPLHLAPRIQIMLILLPPDRAPRLCLSKRERYYTSKTRERTRNLNTGRGFEIGTRKWGTWNLEQEITKRSIIRSIVIIHGRCET